MVLTVTPETRTFPWVEREAILSCSVTLAKKGTGTQLDSKFQASGYSNSASARAVRVEGDQYTGFLGQERGAHMGSTKCWFLKMADPLGGFAGQTEEKQPISFPDSGPLKCQECPCVSV